MDWSLLRLRAQHFLLRDNLGYSSHVYVSLTIEKSMVTMSDKSIQLYYFAIVSVSLETRSDQTSDLPLSTGFPSCLTVSFDSVGSSIYRKKDQVCLFVHSSSASWRCYDEFSGISVSVSLSLTEGSAY
jgi:hypothetical protein